MKCRRCGKEGTVKLPWHNTILCDECFVDFFHNQIRKLVHKTKALSKEDVPVVALSGGEDSFVAAEALLNMGYKVKGLHIHMSYGEYSEKCLTAVAEFAEKKDIEVAVVHAEEVLGMPPAILAKKLRRPTCSICSIVKKRLMNDVGREMGTVLITGHHLDDETAALLGNLLRWQMKYLSRKKPVLERENSFMKKAKILAFLQKTEVKTYARIMGIKGVEEKCPYSKGAHIFTYAKVLDEIERESPGTKTYFYRQYLKLLEENFFPSPTPPKNRCEKCGVPTNGKLCNFCLLVKKAVEIKQQHEKEKNDSLN